MANSWKDHRGVTTLLLVAVVVIWGTVLYRVMTGMEETPSTSGSPSSTQVDVPKEPVDRNRDRTRYEGRFRDPFLHELGVRRAQADQVSSEDVSDEQENERSQLPPLGFQLVGIVEETAMLKDGETIHLVTAGDSLSARRGEVVVQTVTSEEVVVIRNQDADTLRLPRREWARLFEDKR